MGQRYDRRRTMLKEKQLWDDEGKGEEMMMSILPRFYFRNGSVYVLSGSFVYVDVLCVFCVYVMAGMGKLERNRM